MGYEVRQYTPLRSLAAARERLLEDVDVVVDVGANAGQYGTMLRELGFEGRLVSLEPVAEAFAELAGLAAADGAWEAVCVAASDVDGEITLNVTGDSRSSSVLRATSVSPTRRAGRPRRAARSRRGGWTG